MERNDVKIIKKRIFIPENSFFILDVLQADKSAALRCITYVPFLYHKSVSKEYQPDTWKLALIFLL